MTPLCAYRSLCFRAGRRYQYPFLLGSKDPLGGNTTGITRTTSYLGDEQGDMEDGIS